jgi:hypothetical protein
MGRLTTVIQEGRLAGAWRAGPVRFAEGLDPIRKVARPVNPARQVLLQEIVP